MLRTFTALIGLCALGVFAQPVTPQFHSIECTSDLMSASSHAVECGLLTVAESDRHPDRKVVLPVTIVRALKSVGKLPPVIFLHGGPGSHAVADVPRMLAGGAGEELIAQDQDWIFFDQRGGKYTSPNLDCPDVEMTDAGPISDKDVTLLRQCLTRFQASGIDLGAYNALQTAADIQALRQALNIGQYHLFGYSNGTRVALTTLDHYPQGLRAVVLDSVWPREQRWAEGTAKTLADAVHELERHCQQNKSCAQQFPLLAERMERVAKRFLAKPQRAANGKLFSDAALAAFLMDSLYAQDAIDFLPAQIVQISEGDLSPLQAFEFDDYRSTGAHMSYVCHDELVFEARENIRANAGDDAIAQLAVGSLSRYFDVCNAISTPSPVTREGLAVSSDIPTLFVSAQIDPGCPPEFTELAAKRFSQGQYVMVRNTTHGVFLASPCGRQMMRQFLQDPAKPIDRSCNQVSASDT